MVESMNPSFTGKGDTMPSGRWKFIHNVGTVSKVEFVPANLDLYTGIFKGAKYGLIRLSSAAKPSDSKINPLANALGPGMGLKFLRDGMDSANLVSMYSVDGQPGDWNFFSNSFSNHVKDATGIQTIALSKKF
jgi:hypothetical protein